MDFPNPPVGVAARNHFSFRKRLAETVSPWIREATKVEHAILRNKWEIVFVVVAILLGLWLRYSLRLYPSFDFNSCTGLWYEAIKQNGTRAFVSGISDYTPTYIYILYFVQHLLPSVPDVVAIKLPSIGCDILLAGFSLGILWEATRSKFKSILGAICVFFAPTVFINSSYWGQADSIYAAALLASTWMLLKQKWGWAMIAFGVSFALKLQSIFFLPFLIGLVAVKFIPWKYIFLTPLPMLVSLLPAWIRGRALIDLLSIYFNQTGEYRGFTFNAASAYAWFFPQQYQWMFPGTLVFLICLIFLFVALLYFRRHKKIDNQMLVLLSSFCVLFVPFFLPNMHERYFYLSDVFTILMAFCYPGLFIVPILSQLASFFSYQPFLSSDNQIFPLPVLSFGYLAGLILMARAIIQYLYFKPLALGKLLAKKRVHFHI